MTISIVIPAYNEAQRIGEVVKAAHTCADEVLVVDDGSGDGTSDAAREAGVLVIHQEHGGYISAIKRGFREARGDIVVTMDADGEHCSQDIPRLTAPILSGNADLVLGSRPRIDRLSERFLNRLTKFRVKVKDCGTGFRAMRRESALKLELRGKCTCGVFVLEAAQHGERIVEVPINVQPTSKKRKILWSHFQQVFYVLHWLMKSAANSRQSIVGTKQRWQEQRDLKI